jgi:hypothetical protein
MSKLGRASLPDPIFKTAASGVFALFGVPLFRVVTIV